MIKAYSWQEMVELLELEPHPEGGFYRETWRSWITLPRDSYSRPGNRSVASTILFLLPAGTRSQWHRVDCDELWLHQAGDPIRLLNSPIPGSRYSECVLGVPPCFQFEVSARRWQMAEALEGPHGYALAACVVVPAFEFEDFELADPSEIVTDPPPGASS